MTTSATGKALLQGRSCRSRAGSQGFTLVELLVVMAILLSLAALVYVAVGQTTTRAKARATAALIQRVGLYLEAYKRKAGHYPPDGIDTDVTSEEGEKLRGAAALYHALSSPLVVDTMVAGVPRTIAYDPVAQFEEAVLTDEDPEYPGVRELRDAFGVPLHYDNTENGLFQSQGGDVHYPPLDEFAHPPDPRTLPEEEGGVPVPGQNQAVGYDLWSHGERGHDADAPPNPPVANWNVKE